MSHHVSLRTPRVLVLLASYNGRPWLAEQVASILSQQHVEVFIRIADDGSNDGTRELIAQEWLEHPQISFVFRSVASGSAGANFRQLYRESDASGFDYVALADQDDIWIPGKLGAAIAALVQSGAQGYSCAVRPFWEDGRETDVPQCPTMRKADFLFEGGGQGCTYVMTNELFSRTSSFCQNQYELCENLHYHDWLVYLLARAWHMAWHFDATPWIRYRQHTGNEIGSRGSIGAITRRLAMIRNGWYRNQVLAAIAVSSCVMAHNPILTSFAVLFRQPAGVVRQVRVCFFVLMHGRRRISDRMVLAWSALAGWI